LFKKKKKIMLNTDNRFSLGQIGVDNKVSENPSYNNILFTRLHRNPSPFGFHHSLTFPMADLPSNLFTEILSRLPVQSLIRFQSTSKSLKSLIDSHNFTNLYLKTL